LVVTAAAARTVRARRAMPAGDDAYRHDMSLSTVPLGVTPTDLVARPDQSRQRPQ
jgi:hypothetical protein